MRRQRRIERLIKDAHFREALPLSTFDWNFNPAIPRLQIEALAQGVQAFHHLGGVARVCLYDNFKAVVLRHDADGPLYNPKFLAFATHYGFKPWACQVRRPQTKGKVERKFFYVATSLLNGRTFDTLAHLNEVTAWWLANVADVRRLRDLGETPLQRHERERPELLPLPTADYDTALVVYRHVNAEGFITHRLNFYSVPWTYIGQVLPVRITESEVIIYSVSLDEIARHALVSGTLTGVKQKNKSHHPAADPAQRALLLRQRFSELGPVAVQSQATQLVEESTPAQTETAPAEEMSVEEAQAGPVANAEHATEPATETPVETPASDSATLVWPEQPTTNETDLATYDIGVRRRTAGR